MQPMVRQKDLARQLQVTQCTVSRALRGDPKISRRVRERVVTAALQAGYELPGGETPDLAGILPRRTGVVCVDIERTDEWHERLLDGIVAAARETNHEIMVSAHTLGDLPLAVARGQVDGLIRLLCRDDYAASAVPPAPVPTVSIFFPIPGADVVTVDHFTSAYDLGMHVGSQRPGIAAYLGHGFPFGDSKVASPIAQARFNGFRAGLETWGAALPAELVRMAKKLEFDGVAPLLDELLDLRAAGAPEHQFTVIGFYNDYLARHAVHHLRRRGLRVPEDIGVVGYDDVDMPLARDLELTTVHLPLEEMGAEAVRRLHWRLDNPDAAPLRWTLETRVVSGGSVVNRSIT